MKAKNAAARSFDTLAIADYFNLIGICLYLLVDFIPKGDAIDFNGPQWLYVGILNIVIILYLFSRNGSSRNENDTQFTGTFFKKPALVYGLFCLIAGLSFFSAFNSNEFLVCYSRCLIAFIGFVNILIMLQRSERIFPYVAQVIAAIVFFKCLEALQTFFTDVSTSGLTTAVLNMKGDTGNKNIFSSGIAIKIPFVLYCLFTGKKIRKIINFVILTTALYTLFIASARSAFVSVFAETLIYAVYCIYDYTRHKEAKSLVQQLGFFLVPVLAGILLSQITVDTQRRATIDATGTAQTTPYGTFTERVSTINFSDEGTSGRLDIWKAGISLFKAHPFTGIGYGNWKICSIPYERLSNNDNAISVHAHNDFIETLGETGIFGGIAYALVFLLAPLLSLKNLFSRSIPTADKIILLFSLIGLGSYFVDSVFNFPMERATMQTYFILFLAVNVNENYKLTSLSKAPKPFTFNKLKFYLVGALLVIMPATYITYQVWQSMVVQSLAFVDVNADVLVHKSYEINDQFPAITDVTMWGLPISSIKGRYLINEGKFDEGVAMLDKVAKENPYLYYAEFQKGKMYFENGKYDSAYKYSIIAFDNRPRNLAYFSLLAFTCANKNDSIRLKKSFDLFTRYRKDGFVARAWNNYLYALTVMKYPVPFMVKVADSALKLYPTDTVTVNNSAAMHRMAGDKVAPPVTLTNAALNSPQQTLPQNGVPPQGAPGSPGNPVTAAQQAAMKDSAIFYDVFRRGNEAFIKSDFKTAIELFENSLKINPTFYPAIENIGLSHFLQRDWASAVKYLDMVVNGKMSNDGKAEYYRGISLINLGKRDEGCESFMVSEKKKYYDARRLIDLNCPNQANKPAGQ